MTDEQGRAASFSKVEGDLAAGRFVKRVAGRLARRTARG
jgi:hypothetical protein